MDTPATIGGCGMLYWDECQFIGLLSASWLLESQPQFTIILNLLIISMATQSGVEKWWNFRIKHKVFTNIDINKVDRVNRFSFVIRKDNLVSKVNSCLEEVKKNYAVSNFMFGLKMNELSVILIIIPQLPCSTFGW